jgi:hypothetical protein
MLAIAGYDVQSNSGTGIDDNTGPGSTPISRQHSQPPIDTKPGQVRILIAYPTTTTLHHSHFGIDSKCGSTPLANAFGDSRFSDATQAYPGGLYSDKITNQRIDVRSLPFYSTLTSTWIELPPFNAGISYVEFQDH